MMVDLDDLAGIRMPISKIAFLLFLFVLQLFPFLCTWGLSGDVDGGLGTVCSCPSSMEGSIKLCCGSPGCPCLQVLLGSDKCLHRRLLFFQAGQKPNVKSRGGSWPCGKLALSTCALRREHFIALFHLSCTFVLLDSAVLMGIRHLGHLHCCQHRSWPVHGARRHLSKSP